MFLRGACLHQEVYGHNHAGSAQCTPMPNYNWFSSEEWQYFVNQITQSWESSEKSLASSSTDVNIPLALSQFIDTYIHNAHFQYRFLILLNLLIIQENLLVYQDRTFSEQHALDQLEEDYNLSVHDGHVAAHNLASIFSYLSCGQNTTHDEASSIMTSEIVIPSSNVVNRDQNDDAEGQVVQANPVKEPSVDKDSYTLENLKAASNEVRQSLMQRRQHSLHTAVYYLSWLVIRGSMIGFGWVNLFYFTLVFGAVLAPPVLYTFAALVFLGQFFVEERTDQTVVPTQLMAFLTSKKAWQNIFKYRKKGKTLPLSWFKSIALVCGWVISAVASFVAATMVFAVLGTLAFSPVGWFLCSAVFIVTLVCLIKSISSFVKQEDWWASIKESFWKICGYDPETAGWKNALRIIGAFLILGGFVTALFFGMVECAQTVSYFAESVFGASAAFCQWLGFVASVVIAFSAELFFILENVGVTVQAFLKYIPVLPERLKAWWNKPLQISAFLKTAYQDYIGELKTPWSQWKRDLDCISGFQCLRLGVEFVFNLLVLSPWRLIIGSLKHFVPFIFWQITEAIGDASISIVGALEPLLGQNMNLRGRWGTAQLFFIGIFDGISCASEANFDNQQDDQQDQQNEKQNDDKSSRDHLSSLYHVLYVVFYAFFEEPTTKLDHVGELTPRDETASIGSDDSDSDCEGERLECSDTTSVCSDFDDGLSDCQPFSEDEGEKCVSPRNIVISKTIMPEVQPENEKSDVRLYGIETPRGQSHKLKKDWQKCYSTVPFFKVVVSHLDEILEAPLKTSKACSKKEPAESCLPQ